MPRWHMVRCYHVLCLIGVMVKRVLASREEGRERMSERLESRIRRRGKACRCGVLCVLCWGRRSSLGGWSLVFALVACQLTDVSLFCLGLYAEGEQSHLSRPSLDFDSSSRWSRNNLIKLDCSTEIEAAISNVPRIQKI